ncbi:MAG: energy transducer TonB [Myxococcales bacterium]|nr:energy transducer TonB [Myxococcales bacterium]
MTALTAAERPLRVAFLWNETIQQEELLSKPEAVTLGGMFPLPDGHGDLAVPVLIPQGHGYALQAGGGLGGSVWIGGQRRDVATLSGTVPLGPDDYGVVTLGPVAVFFQHVRGAKAPPRQAMRLDMSLLFSVLLSFLIIGSIGVIAFLDYQRHNFGERDPFELNADLVTRFMVTPPPEDLLQEMMESGDETEDPGLNAREEGGTRHEGDEGRVGEERAQREDTHIQGEVTDRIATKVRNMGLLGALSGGGEGNAIAAALDVPTISDILGGMGDGPTQVGRGSGGAGLLGVGSGGGGTGPGSLFGAGNLGTGTGAGRGSGVGRGSGGVGARGRPAREVQVSVQQGTPRVSGYLSAEQINRVVRANAAAIRYCYEVEVQRQPNLRGRVEIAWRINRQGAVTTSRVASSTLNNARVEGCIVRQVQRWRFPEPDGGEVNVTYPFIFGVSGG